jgi:hypothetical protein
MSAKEIKLRPALRRFAEAMEMELRRLDRQRGKKGWRRDDFEGSLHENMATVIGMLHDQHLKLLVAGLPEEEADLINSVRDNAAVDIANLAMMIYDLARPEAK